MGSVGPSLANEDLFYLIVANLIDGKNYEYVLKFLNISKNINQLIEHKVLSNQKLYDQKILGSLPLRKVKEFIDDFVIDIVNALNNCQWFSVTKKEKLKLEKTIYDFLIQALTNQNITFYKGVGFKILESQNDIIISKVDKIANELLEVVDNFVNLACIMVNWRKDYTKTLIGNLYNTLNSYNQRYQSLKSVNRNSYNSYNTSSFGRFRYEF
jgi:hypothetical protein